MSPTASLPSAMEGPLGTVQWSEVVNCVPENGPQHRQAGQTIRLQLRRQSTNKAFQRCLLVTLKMRK